MQTHFVLLKFFQIKIFVRKWLTFSRKLVIMNKSRGVIPDFLRERIMIIMKKTLSMVLALAMVFVMSFAVFAEGEEVVKPTDPTELGAYYAELLNAEDSDPAVVAQMILDDLIIGEGDEGVYTVEDLPTVITAFVDNSTDTAKLDAAAEQIVAGLESMGIVLPEMPELPELPGGEGDGEGGELVPDEEPTDDTGFLNTILGILGSIGDMIFGSGSGDDPTGDDPSGDNGDNAWGDGDADADGDNDDLVSDTGDTTVISVAAVALVAGAALVLTRKKSEDAE